MNFDTVSFISMEALRSLATVLAFGAFIAVCVWAYSSKRRDDFEEAANLPFADDHSSRDTGDKHS